MGFAIPCHDRKPLDAPAMARRKTSSEVEMITTSKPIRRHLSGVLVDALIGVALFIGYGVLKGIAKPFVRGFYCDDDSIKFPYKVNTISTTLLISLGTVIPLVVILFIECLNHYYHRRASITRSAADSENTFGTSSCKIRFWLWRMFERMGYAAVGGVVSQVLTDVVKFMAGSLRPHFLAVCKPNVTLLDCSAGYIGTNVCTGNPSDIEEARQSFPSGHASFSAYSMFFVILYLHYTLHAEKARLIKPLSQLVALLITVSCCVTRVTDFHHHLLDVSVGFALGVLVAIYVVYCGLNLPEEERTLRTEVTMAYNQFEDNSKVSSDPLQALSPRDGVKNYGLEKIP